MCYLTKSTHEESGCKSRDISLDDLKDPCPWKQDRLVSLVRVCVGAHSWLCTMIVQVGGVCVCVCVTVHDCSPSPYDILWSLSLPLCCILPILLCGPIGVIKNVCVCVHATKKKKMACCVCVFGLSVGKFPAPGSSSCPQEFPEWADGAS